MSKKIDTAGGDSLGSNPFDALSSSGLPKAKPTPAKEKKKKPASKKGRVEVRREKSGRGGKTVTSLSNFATHLPLAELDKLAFDLKKSCACGGTLKGRTVELQGDVCDRVLAELEKRGYQPVRAGG